MSHDVRELGVITINGTRFPSEMYVNNTTINAYDPKVVDGDYTRDSDKNMSAKIWTTFAGGIGVENHREGADEGRSWFCLANVERPFQMALPDRVEAYTGVKYPLGTVSSVFYASSGTTIQAWDETNLEFDASAATLSSTPVHRGVAWNGSLYIPCGASGYEIFTPASTINPETRKVAAFIVWDNRLFSLTTDGKLGYSSTNPAIDATWTDVATLDTSINPKRLEIYFDRADNEVIYISTDVGLWTYDPTGLKFVRTRMRLPPHPDNGLGMAQWRSGEDLWVSAGLQVYRYTGAATVPSGPDRSEGLPAEFRGRVVDLDSEHNALLALVEGVSLTADVDPDAAFDAGMGNEDEFEAASTSAKSMLLAYTGSGWLPQWISADDSGSLTWLCVVGTSATYRIFWGYGNNIYSIKRSRSFSNVRQRYEVGEGDFATSGYIDTGWVDHNMREFDKLASHCEINMEYASDDETVTVFYRTDYDAGWTQLHEPAVARGKTILPFGVETLDDGTQFSRGLSYRRIRFRLDLARGSDTSLTPLIDSFTLKHIRLPLTGDAFTLTIPLDFEEWEGRSPEQIKVELDQLIDANEFLRLEHGYDDDHMSHRCRITRMSGLDRTGYATYGARTISILVIPLDGHDGNHSE